MTCPNCGMEMPEGSVSCPTCGYQVAQQPQGDYYAQQPQAPVNNAAPMAPAEPAKKKTGLLIGIIVGGIAVVAAVVCLILFVFNGKGGTDGKYVCSSLSAFGMDIYLDVDGEDVEMVMSYDVNGDGELSDDEKESNSGTIEFDGDTCTITIEVESMDCAYDKKEGTITMSDEAMMGMELVFEKE